VAGFYICIRSYRLAYQDRLDTAQSDFEHSYAAVESFAGRMNHLATIIQYNSSLVDMLSQAQDYTVDEYRRTRQDLIPMLFSMQDGSGDYACRMYVRSSLELVDRTSHILLLDDIEDEPWARQAMAGWGWWNLYSARKLGSDRPAFLAAIRNQLRKPDIVGHFDLITKFDEKDVPIFLDDHRYQRVAEKYLSEVVKCDCYFEVNTGAIGRGYRTTPYPAENLLQILYQYDARIILSSDSHSVQTLDQSFGETKAYLKDIGFRHAYALYNDEFTKYEL